MSAREPAQDSASFVEGLDADVREFLREWGIDPAADLATVRADARELADIRARWIADSAPGGDAEEIAAAAREADRCAALADRYCRALETTVSQIAQTRSLSRQIVSAMRAAESAIESIGYRLLAADLDLELGRARVEVRRHDGYTLTLDVRNGAGTITREMARVDVIAVGRRGDRFRADRMRVEFLGRSHVAGGARTALRAFAAMIGDNSKAGRLSARNAIRALLNPNPENL